MAAANVPTKACPCKNKMSSWDPHQMCVMCLGLKHAQAAFESMEECTHCDRFSLEVLCRRLACQMNLPGGNPIRATAAAQEPMDLVEMMAPEAEAGLSWGAQLDFTDLLPQELIWPGLAAGPIHYLVRVADDDLDGGLELLMTD